MFPFPINRRFSGTAKPKSRHRRFGRRRKRQCGGRTTPQIPPSNISIDQIVLNVKTFDLQYEKTAENPKEHRKILGKMDAENRKSVAGFRGIG